MGWDLGERGRGKGKGREEIKGGTEGGVIDAQKGEVLT